MALDSGTIEAAAAVVTLVVGAVAVPIYRAWVGLNMSHSELKGEVKVLRRDHDAMAIRETGRDSAISRMSEGINGMAVMLGKIETAIHFMGKQKAGEED